MSETDQSTAASSSQHCRSASTIYQTSGRATARCARSFTVFTRPLPDGQCRPRDRTLRRRRLRRVETISDGGRQYVDYRTPAAGAGQWRATARTLHARFTSPTVSGSSSNRRPLGALFCSPASPPAVDPRDSAPTRSTDDGLTSPSIAAEVCAGRLGLARADRRQMSA